MFKIVEFERKAIRSRHKMCRCHVIIEKLDSLSVEKFAFAGYDGATADPLPLCQVFLMCGELREFFRSLNRRRAVYFWCLRFSAIAA